MEFPIQPSLAIGYDYQTFLEEQNNSRRTLYWNPDLQLDANGEAKVTFYNNARTTTLSIEAEGQAADGVLLWGKWGADRSAPPVPETSHAGSAAETAAIRHHTVSHCHS